MRERELTVLRKNLAKLTRTQRRRLVAELTSEERQVASVAVIEGACAHRKCPHCDAERIVKNGTADGWQRFKCRACAKTFNVLTGTPLAHLHLRGKWLEQATVMRDGLSLTQAMQRLNVARTTALRWRHRFLAAPKAVQAQVLNGVAETDETFFLRSCKGQRSGLTRKARPRGGKAAKRGLSKEQVPVLIARDRSGATADFILDVDDASHVVAALKPILPPDAILCTDSSRTLIAAAQTLKVDITPSICPPAFALTALGTSRTSMPTTAASRGGFAIFTAFRRATSIPTSAGSEPSSGHPEKPCSPRPSSLRPLWHKIIIRFRYLSL